MGTEDLFGRAQSEHEHRDDEENLRWAAMEKLPTYDRMRQGILRRALEDQQQSGGVEVVDIQKLAGGDGGRELLERLFQDDSERFLRRLRDRIDMYVHVVVCLIGCHQADKLARSFVFVFVFIRACIAGLASSPRPSRFGTSS